MILAQRHTDNDSHAGAIDSVAGVALPSSEIARGIDTGELAAPERYIAVYEDWNVDATMIWDRLDPISHIEFIRLKASIGRDERLQASMVKLDLTETPTRPPKGF